MTKSCSVCKKDSSPYKCPKCSFLYCSVACCKVHKVSCQDQEKSSLFILDNEKIDNEKIDNEKIDNKKIDNEKLDNEKIDNEKLDNEKLDNEKSITEYLITEKSITEKSITEKSITDSVENDKSIEAKNANTNDCTSSVSTDLSTKLKSSLKLNNFLKSHPYLSEQLPVLLARINRSQPNNLNTSQLTRDLEKKQRISDLLKEAIETDPKISELYSILRDEDLI